MQLNSYISTPYVPGPVPGRRRACKVYVVPGFHMTYPPRRLTYPPRRFFAPLRALLGRNPSFTGSGLNGKKPIVATEMLGALQNIFQSARYAPIQRYRAFPFL